MVKRPRETKIKTWVETVLVVAVMSVGAAPAVAHSFLVDATPSSKDHVAAAPKAIKLRFGGGVEPSYSTITVEDAKGKIVAEGATGKPDTPRELVLDTPKLSGAGRHVVRYRVLSTDGHIAQGAYEFFVDGQ
ncbi:MAG: copper resistance protein CopC [Methylocystaceae bacterium]|nr:MAG: copper resistance protein CopC [Methylocystaceae bacterium]